MVNVKQIHSLHLMRDSVHVQCTCTVYMYILFPFVRHFCVYIIHMNGHTCTRTRMYYNACRYTYMYVYIYFLSLCYFNCQVWLTFAAHMLCTHTLTTNTCGAIEYKPQPINLPSLFHYHALYIHLPIVV